jgi:Rha family phage regulatory protein
VSKDLVISNRNFESDNIVIDEVDGKLVTRSINVAKVFGKEHKRVLQDIRDMNCSEKFAERNFVPGSYLDQQNQKRPMYSITRDGWTMLVMGYTGEKAMKFKEAYIAMFNKMENERKSDRSSSNRSAIKDYKNAISLFNMSHKLIAKRTLTDETALLLANEATMNFTGINVLSHMKMLKEVEGKNKVKFVELDHVKDFIDEVYDFVADSRVKVGECFEDYLAWCDKSGIKHPITSKNSFGRKISKILGRKTYVTHSIRYYVGLSKK